MPKLILLLLFVSSLSWLTSCASVPDVPVCTEITPFRGWCTWTVSEKEQFVDDQNKLNDMTWWEIRPAFVMVPPWAYAEIKSAFIKMCKKNGNCNADIDLWERKFHKIEEDK